MQLRCKKDVRPAAGVRRAARADCHHQCGPPPAGTPPASRTLSISWLPWIARCSRASVPKGQQSECVRANALACVTGGATCAVRPLTFSAKSENPPFRTTVSAKMSPRMKPSRSVLKDRDCRNPKMALAPSLPANAPSAKPSVTGLTAAAAVACDRRD